MGTLNLGAFLQNGYFILVKLQTIGSTEIKKGEFHYKLQYTTTLYDKETDPYPYP